MSSDETDVASVRRGQHGAEPITADHDAPSSVAAASRGAVRDHHESRTPYVKAAIGSAEAAHPVGAIAFVRLSAAHFDASESVRARIDATPEILFALPGADAAEFVVLVGAPAVEAYERFAQRFQDANADVLSYESRIVFDTTTGSLAGPVEPTAADEALLSLVRAYLSATARPAAEPQLSGGARTNRRASSVTCQRAGSDLRRSKRIG